MGDMADMADMEMKRSFEEWLDERCPSTPVFSSTPKMNKHKYKEILKETEKAWYIKMDAGEK